MQLQNFGWNGFFASQSCAGVPGRVASVSHEQFLVWTDAGELDATVSGRLRHSGSLWPAVGDWVSLRPDAPLIEQVFDRRTVLSRKQPGRAAEEQVLAANIDVLFIVTGLDRDYNERRIERYLVVARQSGAQPIILLNKADLAAEHGVDLAGAISRLQQSSGVPVLTLNMLTGDGISALGDRVAAGETAALIGSSGVGKSTILNRLLGQQRQATSAVRSDESRGRHTTTTRSMFQMPGGWLLIDMPGLREVQLWAEPDQLDSGFDDIARLAHECRFRDCSHAGEPGCAVQNAGMDEDRLANYHKMQKELDYLERKTDKRLMSENKARWKVTHKAMRNYQKPGS